MDDKSSLSTALAGSSVVFAMTNCKDIDVSATSDGIHAYTTLDWEKISAEVEVAQGKAIADAAVAAGAEFIIWSSLPNVTRMSEGKIKGAIHVCPYASFIHLCLFTEPVSLNRDRDRNDFFSIFLYTCHQECFLSASNVHAIDDAYF